MKRLILFTIIIFLNILIYSKEIEWGNIERGIVKIKKAANDKEFIVVVHGISTSLLNIDEETAVENARQDASKTFGIFLQDATDKIKNKKNDSKINISIVQFSSLEEVLSYSEYKNDLFTGHVFYILNIDIIDNISKILGTEPDKIIDKEYISEELYQFVDNLLLR